MIAFARNTLRDARPDRADAVTGRLVGEFEAEKRDRGAVRLPEAVPPQLLEGLMERGRRLGSAISRGSSRPPAVAP